MTKVVTKKHSRLQRLATSAAHWIAKRRRPEKEGYILILIELKASEFGEAETCVRSDLEPKSLLDALKIAAQQVHDHISSRQTPIHEKGPPS